MRNRETNGAISEAFGVFALEVERNAKQCSDYNAENALLKVARNARKVERRYKIKAKGC